MHDNTNTTKELRQNGKSKVRMSRDYLINHLYSQKEN